MMSLEISRLDHSLFDFGAFVAVEIASASLLMAPLTDILGSDASREGMAFSSDVSADILYQLMVSSWSPFIDLSLPKTSFVRVWLKTKLLRWPELIEFGAS
jgi:hypothetical protein